MRAFAGEFDAVVAPYHDVGMAAFKTAAFGRGVNVTIGLPFVRTSPDHGTAFDIAGRGVADPSSMIAAVGLAGRLAGGRGGRDTPGNGSPLECRGILSTGCWGMPETRRGLVGVPAARVLPEPVGSIASCAPAGLAAVSDATRTHVLGDLAGLARSAARRGAEVGKERDPAPPIPRPIPTPTFHHTMPPPSNPPLPPPTFGATTVSARPCAAPSHAAHFPPPSSCTACPAAASRPWRSGWPARGSAPAKPSPATAAAVAVSRSAWNTPISTGTSPCPAPGAPPAPASSRKPSRRHVTRSWPSSGGNRCAPRATPRSRGSISRLLALRTRAHKPAATGAEQFFIIGDAEYLVPRRRARGRQRAAQAARGASPGQPSS